MLLAVERFLQNECNYYVVAVLISTITWYIIVDMFFNMFQIKNMQNVKNQVKGALIFSIVMLITRIFYFLMQI